MQQQPPTGKAVLRWQKGENADVLPSARFMACTLEYFHLHDTAVTPPPLQLSEGIHVCVCVSVCMHTQT